MFGVDGMLGDGGSPAVTLAELRLPDEVRERLGKQLAPARDPFGKIDRTSARCHQTFAQLPLEPLQLLLDFGRHCDASGVVHLRKLPVDRMLPLTPRATDRASGSGRSPPRECCSG
ncbi:hypothetical protein [Streptomyces sp. NBC_01363]|uniref:hypothetical protein n=1 Tax=Streptomyces sp. NBC_01363 TaxID=2903840 RepID=UPI0022507649|nr:hypothetical protein [Streptomyces sp. NBC_01363]MCX4736818.1 hypothetical protein [Streptomyces sp. NBC_01363]